jgi:hypothetical protein
MPVQGFPKSFSQVLSTRLLVTVVAVVGVCASVVPLAYAQDVPTPTPPADGGEFMGAPEPTPAPELEDPASISEPTSDFPETPTVDSTVTEETDSTGGVSGETPATESAGMDGTGDASIATPAASGAEAGPSVTESSPGSAATDSAQTPISSPRGLW